MMIKVKCPNCEETHYVDIVIRGHEKKKFKSTDELFQYTLDNIVIKGIFTEESVLENL